MSNYDFLKDKSPVIDFDYFRNVYTPDTTDSKRESARGFVIKLDSELSGISDSTYLGGMLIYNSYTGGNSYVSSLAVSESGRIYAAGAEYSGKIKTGQNALQSEHAEAPGASRTTDAFIAELGSDLKIKNATYYGGKNSDAILKIKAQNGCVYAAGMSASTDLKVSSNAYQKDLKMNSSEYYDGFVLRLSESLQRDAQFAATYIGGTEREDLYDMDIDQSGNVAVTGRTYSLSSYPTTDSTSGTSYYISVLNDRLTALKASSLIKNGEGRIVRFLPDNIVLTAGMSIKQGKWQATVEKMDGTLAHADISQVYRFEKPASNQPIYLGKGSALNIIVSFDNAVIVTKTPKIKLNIKNSYGENAYAVYREPTAEEKASEAYDPIGNGTKRLMFTYTVQEGDTTEGNVLQCAGDTIELADGSGIMPKSGAGNIDLTLPSNSRGLKQSFVYVNTKALSALSVKAGVNSGSYGTGTTIPIMVDFGEKGLTANDPDGNSIYIDMNNGGRAYFDSIDEETGYAVFKYKVSSSDKSIEKLSYTGGINVLGDAFIKDAYGTYVDKELPEPDTVSPMGRQIAIDVLAASVKAITADRGAGYCKKGDTVNIAVEFDKPITSTGEARLALNVLMNKPVSYITAPAVSSSSKLEFTYTVDDENTGIGEYLDYISSAALSMADGAELKAVSGSPASLTLPIPGKQGSLSDAKIMIDTKAPSVQLTNRNSASSGYPKDDKYYRAGEVIALEAQFSETVKVKDGADISIKMETGPGNRPLVLKYQKTEANQKNLVFAYTVAEGDILNNATLKNASGEWRIECSDGDIRDEAGNTADLILPNPYSANNQWSGIFFDTDAPSWDKGSLSYDIKRQQDGTASIEFKWPSASDATSGLDLSAFYYVYRDGLLIKTTNAVTYTDTGVKEGTYRYTVKARDKAGNESESLTLDVTVSDGITDSCKVETEIPDGFKNEPNSSVNEITVLNDAENADIKLKVSDIADTFGGTPQNSITVLWTQMRGNKMVAYGTKTLELSADPNNSGVPSAECVIKAGQIKKDDKVNIFVVKDPLQLIKGTVSRILNIH